MPCAAPENCFVLGSAEMSGRKGRAHPFSAHLRERVSRTTFSVGATAFLLALSCSPASPRGTGVQVPQPKSAQSPPEPGRKEQGVKEEIFGSEVADPFRWLEDETAKPVQDWMKNQDEAARASLSALPHREWLKRRLQPLLYVNTRSAPRKRGGRYFYSEKRVDDEKSIHYVIDPGAKQPRVLLDPNRLSEDGSVSIGSIYPTNDGKLIAYMEKQNNADESTLKILQVDTLEERTVDRIPGLRYTAPSWLPDGSGFYYTWRPSGADVPETERSAHAEVRFHQLGTDPSTDAMIVPKTGDATTFIGAWVSEDGKYLLRSQRKGWSRSQLWFKRQDSHSHFEMLTPADAKYSAVAYKDKFYIRTDWDAPRYRVFVATPDKPAREHWKLLVPESEEGAVLTSMDIVGGQLALRYLKNAQTELELRELDGTGRRLVPLPAIGTASSLAGREDDDEAYFSFSSFTHPTEVYRFSVRKNQRELYHRVDVPVDSKALAVRQEWFTSKDGTKVPMFVVHRKGLEYNGKNPTLLYGYGGFNISLQPSFHSTVFPWLDAGGVFVVANLRGGGEFGEQWHEAGMRENKQNVFDDFIGAAEALVAKGVTTPKRLAISGGSNGGLLVGAAMTQRPDLFGAVVCSVPLLDMLRYHKFGLGTAWIPEYGDPDMEADFRVLQRYSPYHRLSAGTDYPPLLMLSADTDDRVDPMHARKFVAQLMEVEPESNPLLRIERNAGHGGADLRRASLLRAVDQYAFLMHQLGVSVPPQ